MPFQVRDARLEDFETLWQIDQQCFPPEISYSQRELKFYMRRRHAFTLVAVAENDPNPQFPGSHGIAGFIVVHGGPTGHIITIDVIAEARRLGVGSLLLHSAEQQLFQEGSMAVGLETAVDNTSALGFYKRHGYSVIRTWPRYYSNGVDALVMKKELRAVVRISS